MRKANPIFMTCVGISAFVFLGCPSIPFSVFVIDDIPSRSYTERDLHQNLQLRIDTLYTEQTLNRRFQSLYEARIVLADDSEIWAKSVSFSQETLHVSENDVVQSLPIDSVLLVTVFDESYIFSKLWRSSAIGLGFATLPLAAYLPPNPPEPDTESFLIAGGIGFTLGVAFADREEQHIIFVRSSKLDNDNRRQLYQKYVGALTGRYRHKTWRSRKLTPSYIGGTGGTSGG